MPRMREHSGARCGALWQHTRLHERYDPFAKSDALELKREVCARSENANGIYTSLLAASGMTPAVRQRRSRACA
jgi:hypothetical protein